MQERRQFPYSNRKQHNDQCDPQQHRGSSGSRLAVDGSRNRNVFLLLPAEASIHSALGFLGNGDAMEPQIEGMFAEDIIGNFGCGNKRKLARHFDCLLVFLQAMHPLLVADPAQYAEYATVVVLDWILETTTSLFD
jgi:hypothetical protein